MSIDVGEPGASVSFSGSASEGSVRIDGGVVSATDFPVTDGQLEEQTVSFEIDCG